MNLENVFNVLYICDGCHFTFTNVFVLLGHPCNLVITPTEPNNPIQMTCSAVSSQSENCDNEEHQRKGRKPRKVKRKLENTTTSVENSLQESDSVIDKRRKAKALKLELECRNCANVQIQSLLEEQTTSEQSISANTNTTMEANNSTERPIIGNQMMEIFPPEVCERNFNIAQGTQQLTEPIIRSGNEPSITADNNVECIPIMEEEQPTTSVHDGGILGNWMHDLGFPPR